MHCNQNNIGELVCLDCLTLSCCLGDLIKCLMFLIYNNWWKIRIETRKRLFCFGMALIHQDPQPSLRLLSEFPLYFIMQFIHFKWEQRPVFNPYKMEIFKMHFHRVQYRFLLWHTIYPIMGEKHSYGFITFFLRTCVFFAPHRN